MKKKRGRKENMKKTGRKTRLEIQPKLLEELCEILLSGNTIRTACQTMGLSESTFHDYIRRGDPSQPAHEPRFAQFSQAITRARAEGKRELVRLVAKAAKEDWRAAAFLLERSWPEEYGRRAPEEVEVLTKTQQPPPNITVTVGRDDKSELAVLIMKRGQKAGRR